MQDGPYKAGELARDGGNDNVAMLFLIQSPELLVKPMLGLERDADDGGRLALAPAIEYQRRFCAMPIVPCCFDQQTPHVRVTGFRNRSAALALSR